MEELSNNSNITLINQEILDNFLKTEKNYKEMEYGKMKYGKVMKYSNSKKKLAYQVSQYTN